MHEVLVIGGAGDMGRRMVDELATQGITVTIADRRYDAARQIALRLPNTDAAALDVDNFASLRQAIRGRRLVMNAVGPAYRYAEKIAWAAILEKVGYVDITDDDDATVRLLSLDPVARKQGVSLLVGMGWTPGLANLLAAKGIKQVGEKGSHVDITWGGSANDAVGQAVVEHVIHAVNRQVPMWLDFSPTLVPALAGITPIALPEPFGEVAAYYVGHPEPITIPRAFPELASVTCRGYLLPNELQSLVRAVLDLGWAREPLQVHGMAELLGLFTAVLGHIGQKTAPALSALRVDVEGTNGNKVTYRTVDTMARLTALPAALAALAIIGGTPLPAGVITPESWPDCEGILASLATREIDIEESPTQD